jgi:hypothetical protein
VILTFKDQSSGNTTPLTKNDMLAARYDFDATIRITKGTTLTASARAMLNTGAYTEFFREHDWLLKFKMEWGLKVETRF